MLFNILGEKFESDCPCRGCQSMRADRDFVDGANYSTRVDARRAEIRFTDRHGYMPHRQFGTGSGHVDVSPPETISITVTVDGSRWTEADAHGQPWDHGTITEHAAMMNARAQGVRWRAPARQ